MVLFITNSFLLLITVMFLSAFISKKIVTQSQNSSAGFLILHF